jgi:hypothetical protein
MIIEMRTYKIKSGMRSKFIEIMRAKLFPEHKRIGIKVAGPFPSAEDKDMLFWMRGFPDAASHKSMTAKFYGGEVWTRELSDALLPILEKYDVVAVEAPEGVVQWQ